MPQKINLNKLAGDYASKRHEIRAFAKRCLQPKGLEAATLYASLDCSVLSALRSAFLLPTTQILLSGSIARRESNYYSDFDLVIVEKEAADPGLGPFLNSLQLVTDKSVQVNFGLRQTLMRQFIENPWERLIILDSIALSQRESVIQILGFTSPADVQAAIYETALFFTLSNLVSETNPTDDINLKHGAGMLKYFSFFINALRFLSIPLGQDLEVFRSKYLNYVLALRDDLQAYYDGEISVIGPDFIAFLGSSKKMGRKYGPAIATLNDLRETAGSFFHAHLHTIFEHLRPNVPNFTLMISSALSNDPVTLERVFQMAYPSCWTALFFLAGNKHLPVELLMRLSRLPGYLNRDIRYQAAKNTAADDQLLSLLTDDLHPPVARVAQNRLGLERKPVGRHSIMATKIKADPWLMDLQKISSIAFSLLEEGGFNIRSRQKIAAAKERIAKLLASPEPTEYACAMARIFQEINQIADDLFAEQRSRLNALAINMYQKNKKSFDALTVPELIQLSLVFNHFDSLLKSDDANMLVFSDSGTNELSSASDLLIRGKRIGIVLDNYGELLADLLLMIKLLKMGKQINIFCNDTPFMISDVTQAGLLAFIDQLAENALTKELGLQLKAGIAQGKIVIIGSDAFCDGITLYAPEKHEFLNSFIGLDLVIIKGDWRYKVAIGMKDWRYDDQLNETDIKYFPANVLLLRNVKSPIIVEEKEPLSPSNARIKEIKLFMRSPV